MSKCRNCGIYTDLTGYTKDGGFCDFCQLANRTKTPFDSDVLRDFKVGQRIAKELNEARSRVLAAEVVDTLLIALIIMALVCFILYGVT